MINVRLKYVVEGFKKFFNFQNDVMKVLTDLDGYDVDGENGDKNLDSLTSVQVRGRSNSMSL